jgi:hypothetical protein
MGTIAKRDKATDIAGEVARGKDLRQRIMTCADEAATRFMNGGNLNDIVADISKRESFNRLQIQRLIEESNTIAYSKRYDQVKKEKDRRFTFDLAELSRVIEKMGDQAPPAVDNPNWVTGKPGDGEMDKSASVEFSPLHNPNMRTKEAREKLLEKRAAFDKVEKSAEHHVLTREINSGIFKIASSLVRTEQVHRRGNQTFNTLLDDVSLRDDLVSGIQKKAAEITQSLIDTRRIHSGFTCSLEVNPAEKVANLLLGEHSLIKAAHDVSKVEAPKVAPTSDISDYQQLIELARKIQVQEQQRLGLQNSMNGEVQAQ